MLADEMKNFAVSLPSETNQQFVVSHFRFINDQKGYSLKILDHYSLSVIYGSDQIDIRKQLVPLLVKDWWIKIHPKFQQFKETKPAIQNQKQILQQNELNTTAIIIFVESNGQFVATNSIQSTQKGYGLIIHDRFKNQDFEVFSEAEFRRRIN